MSQRDGQRVSSGAGARSDFEGRLKSESERFLRLLETLGEKLKRTLVTDCNEGGSPSRDWARSFGHYSQGVRGLLDEQRERVKLKLMAGKVGQAPLTDEEYEAGLRELGLEHVKQLSTADLAAELAARGLTMPAVSDDEH